MSIREHNSKRELTADELDTVTGGLLGNIGALFGSGLAGLGDSVVAVVQSASSGEGGNYLGGKQGIGGLSGVHLN